MWNNNSTGKAMAHDPQNFRAARVFLWAGSAIILSGLMSNAVWGQDPNRHDAVQMWILRGQTKETFQESLVAQAEQTVNDLKQVMEDGSHPLTPEQELRLRLAVKGVGSRFKQDISQLSAKVGLVNLNDINEQRKALAVLQPAMQKMQQGWYGKETFEKIIEKTLEVDQRELLSTRRRERTEQLNKAVVLRVVANIDTRLGMTKAQREKLVELINQQPVHRAPENLQSFVPFVKILRIPKKELEAFLDEKQVETLLALMAPYQQWERSIR